MKITAYIHPARTYLPCTGAGRHINNTLLGLTRRKGIELELLFSQQWLGNDGKLDSRSPLRDLPIRSFPMSENATERTWKLFAFPSMDRYIRDETDWVLTPMETCIPVSKCPVAITLYDIQAFEPDLPWSMTWQHRWFRYKWERWVYRAIAHSRIVFTISEFTKQRLVDLLDTDPQKIVNVGCGVEQPFFDVASVNPATLARPVESPYAFMIGGLRQKKGADHFLAVAERLRQRNSPIKIVIAGNSELTYIKAAAAHPNIKLLGVVPDIDLPRLLRGALCLLFLSLYEGFGIPALEAMAAGVPAVVSNRASLPEVVGTAGLVVDPERPDAIADVLVNLCNNSYLRESYCQLGRKHAAQYTWSRCTDLLMTALEQFG